MRKTDKVPHGADSSNGDSQQIIQIMLNIKRREQFMLIADIRNYSMTGIQLLGKILKGAWRGGVRILKALGMDGTFPGHQGRD